MLQLQVLRFVANYATEAMELVWICIHVLTNSHNALVAHGQCLFNQLALMMKVPGDSTAGADMMLCCRACRRGVSHTS